MRLFRLPKLASLILTSSLSVILSPSLSAQNAVVLYDASTETTCISMAGAGNCDAAPAQLNIGSVFSLRVLHGKPLTQYVLHLNDGEAPVPVSAPILAGGEVHAVILQQLQVLSPQPDLPESSRWSVGSIIKSVLDLSASRSAQSDLMHQHLELEGQRKELEEEMAAFRNAHALIVGNGTNGYCPGDRPYNGMALEKCMNDDLGKLELKMTSPPKSNADFLAIEEQWERWFQEVQTFGHSVTASQLGPRALRLQSKILAYNRNTTIYLSNLETCADAIAILRSAGLKSNPSAAELWLRAQIRPSASGGNEKGAAEPHLNELEQNLYTDAYLNSLQQPGKLPYTLLNDLSLACTPVSGSDPNYWERDEFTDDINFLRRVVSDQIPQLTDAINKTEAESIEVLNAIFERPINSGETNYGTVFTQKSNTIHYSIGELDRFRPYTLVWSDPKDHGADAAPSEVHEFIVGRGAFVASSPGKPRRWYLLGLR